MKVTSKMNSQDLLEFIDRNVKIAYQYDYRNNRRAKEFRRFFCYSSLTGKAVQALQVLEKPILQSNMGAAYLNRQLGEFMMIDPGFKVTAKDGINLTDPRIIDVVEGNFRAEFGDQKDLAYNVYDELLTGGFSVVEIYPDYVSPESTEMKIFIEKAFSPSLCGFDPLARQSHKGDGRFCFQLYPMAIDDAINEFGSKIVENVSFSRMSSQQGAMAGDSTQGVYHWSYTNDKQERIMMICKFYFKKYKETKIVRLSNGYDVELKKFEEEIEPSFRDRIDAQAPKIIGKPVSKQIPTIEECIVCENKLLERRKTNDKYFRLVKFTANSQIIDIDGSGTEVEVTKPYLFHAKDIQTLKNFAVQSLAHELQMISQAKWVACIEGMPRNPEYQKGYITPQIGMPLLYNAFNPDNPSQQLPMPQVAQRNPIEPTILQTIQMSHEQMQITLGSYDSSMGINEGYISSRALETGSMNSNAASKPYMKGFINGWNRLAQIYLDLMPKYYKTPRTIPVITKEGKREYYVINDAKGENVQMSHEASALQVQVEAGVNFEVQKQISMRTLTDLAQAYPSLAAFINEYGGEIILDNIDIRGIDKLKAMYPKFMEEMQQQKQAAGQKQSPEEMLAQVEAMKIQQRDKQSERESMVKVMEIKAKKDTDDQQIQVQASKVAATQAVEEERNDIAFIEVMDNIQNKKDENLIKKEKIDAENARTAVESAIKTSVDIREHQKHHVEMDDRKKNQEISDGLKKIIDTNRIK